MKAFKVVICLFAIVALLIAVVHAEETQEQKDGITKEVQSLSEEEKPGFLCRTCRKVWTDIGKKINSDSTIDALSTFIKNDICWLAKLFPISYPIDASVVSIAVDWICLRFVV